MSAVQYSKKQRRQGFTLTELLVATSIFLILMTALVTLFNSAVYSARQGYASISAFEQGRMAITTMSRDLTNAFTNREFGDVYNFYGRHDGFMFVGALENGELGRVTYVFHPELKTQGSRSTIVERWGVVVDNVRRQTERIAREFGYGFTGAGLQAASNLAITDLEAAYGVHAPDELVEFEVFIETEALIRYEEPGISDLDSYDMYVKRDSGGVPLQLTWPYIDPIEPARDRLPLGPDPAAQFAFLEGAINPDPGTVGTDLRNRYFNINSGGGWPHPVTGDRMYLRVLGRDTFDEMLKARKREFWIRMLSGDPMGVPELQPNASYGSVGYWYDEAFDEVLTANNPRDMKVVNEYVVADGIIARAILLNPNTEQALEIFYNSESPRDIPTMLMDALDAEVKFTYGDGQNAPVHYFNAMENLRDPGKAYDNRDLLSLVNNANGTLNNADLIEADANLAQNLLGNRSSRKNLGSPLLPRVPEVVTPEFWVTRPRVRPGAPDFQRRFQQSIQIPAATGRSNTTTIALSPGGSL